MSYIKSFIRSKTNFETTKFVFEQYENVNSEYADLEYYDYSDDESKNRIRKLQNKLIHYNRLLCSCLYNDIKGLDKLSDNNGRLCKENDKFISLFSELEQLLKKEILIYDYKISIHDFLRLNRINLNHPDNKSSDVYYIHQYNFMIMYEIINYIDEVMEKVEIILNEIERYIGKSKLDKLLVDDDKLKTMININYFKEVEKILNKIIHSMKSSNIDKVDLQNIEKMINTIFEEENEKLLLKQKDEAILKLKESIKNIEISISKYENKNSDENKNKTNEQYLIETIFNKNYNTVINNLYEILDILKRLFSDVNNRKTIFYELKKRNKEYSESILE